MKKEILKISASDSPFSKRLKGRLKSEKMFFLLLSFLNLLGLPVLTAAYLYESWLYKTEKYYMSDSAAVTVLARDFGLCCTAAAMLSGIVCALKMFSHLHKRHKADMIFALPADRKTGFFADYLAGLILYTAPALPGIIISLILLTAGQVNYEAAADFFEFRSFLYNSYKADMFLTTAGITASLLLAMIMFYTVSVMCTVRSSSAPGAVISAAAYNAAVPAAMTVTGGLYEVSSFSRFSLLRLAVYGSPAGVLISAIPFTVLRHPVSAAVINIAVTALLFLLAYRSYMKSLPENVSKPVSDPLIYGLVVYSATLFIPAFMNSISDSRAYFYVAAALVLLICAEIIRKKRFPGYRFSSVWPAAFFTAAALSVFLLPAAGQITGEFGEISHIPDVRNVQAVNIAVDGGYGGSVFQFEFSEPEFIEKAEEVHRAALSAPPPDESDLYYDSFGNQVYRYVTIEYLLKNNRIIQRVYSISEGNRENICRILASQPLRENLVSNISNEINRSETVTVLQKVTDDNDNTNTKRYYAYLNDQLRSELVSAVSEDIAALTDEDFIDYTTSSWFSMQEGSYKVYLGNRGHELETHKLFTRTEEFIRNSIALPDYQTNGFQ